MKSALIRMMAVAMFATSISAFAASENPRAAQDNNPDNTNVGTAKESNATPELDAVLKKLNELHAEVEQLNARDKEREREQQINQEDMNKMMDQQDKRWNDELVGISGG